jgi:hypothetical protein
MNAMTPTAADVRIIETLLQERILQLTRQTLRPRW